ncbi:unnamed protein product [Amoebophrya sp. A120]|nr:unnamed protein product [Amoebophrya sp. A120]|eukprot:GSA120T00006365001.1
MNAGLNNTTFTSWPGRFINRMIIARAKHYGRWTPGHRLSPWMLTTALVIINLLQYGSPFDPKVIDEVFVDQDGKSIPYETLEQESFLLDSYDMSRWKDGTHTEDVDVVDSSGLDDVTSTGNQTQSLSTSDVVVSTAFLQEGEARVSEKEKTGVQLQQQKEVRSKGIWQKGKWAVWMFTTMFPAAQRTLRAYEDPKSPPAVAQAKNRLDAAKYHLIDHATGALEEAGLGRYFSEKHNPALKYSDLKKSRSTLLGKHRVQVLFPKGVIGVAPELQKAFATVRTVTTQDGPKPGTKKIVAAIESGGRSGVLVKKYPSIPIEFLYEVPKKGEVFTFLHALPCQVTGEARWLTCYPGGVYVCTSYDERSMVVKFETCSPVEGRSDQGAGGLAMKSQKGVTANKLYVFAGAAAEKIRVFSPAGVSSGKEDTRDTSGVWIFSPKSRTLSPDQSVTTQATRAAMGIADATGVAASSFVKMHITKPNLFQQVSGVLHSVTQIVPAALFPQSGNAKKQKAKGVPIVLHPFQQTVLLMPVSENLLRFQIDAPEVMFDVNRLLKVDVLASGASESFERLHRSLPLDAGAREVGEVINATVQFADAALSAPTGSGPASPLDVVLNDMPKELPQTTSSLPKVFAKFANKFGSAVERGVADGAASSSFLQWDSDNPSWMGPSGSGEGYLPSRFTIVAVVVAIIVFGILMILVSTGTVSMDELMRR